MKRLSLLYLVLFFLISSESFADQRIAILNFELNDITSLPNTLQEQQRTATIRPLLEQALLQKEGYRIITINDDAQAMANAGFGYLFNHPDLAVKLGERFNTDWVVVSQHSKPSHLFSYLIAKLVHVQSQRMVARFDVELKGTHATVTQHGVDALALQIAEQIDASLK